MPDQPFDRVTEGCSDPANLSFPSFAQDNAQASLVFRPRKHFNGSRGRYSTVEHDTSSPLLQGAIRDRPLERYLIDLFVSVPRMRQTMGQCAVVRHQHQTLARSIEPADRVDMRLAIDRDEIAHRRAALRHFIFQRRYDTAWLVQRDVDRLAAGCCMLVHQRSAVNQDPVNGQVCLIAQFGGHPVHADSSGDDDLFT